MELAFDKPLFIRKHCFATLSAFKPPIGENEKDKGSQRLPMRFTKLSKERRSRCPELERRVSRLLVADMGMLV
jgi:hypothetical protein